MSISSNIFAVPAKPGQGLPQAAVTCSRVYGADLLPVALWAWPFSWPLLEMKDVLNDFILDLWSVGRHGSFQQLQPLNV